FSTRRAEGYTGRVGSRERSQDSRHCGRPPWACALLDAEARREGGQASVPVSRVVCGVGALSGLSRAEHTSTAGGLHIIRLPTSGLLAAKRAAGCSNKPDECECSERREPRRPVWHDCGLVVSMGKEAEQASATR